jgi:hypothetical protein
LEEVILTVYRGKATAHVTLRWKGGALTELDVQLPRMLATIRTDQDTIALVRRLAVHYPDISIRITDTLLARRIGQAQDEVHIVNLRYAGRVEDEVYATLSGSQINQSGFARL